MHLILQSGSASWKPSVDWDPGVLEEEDTLVNVYTSMRMDRKPNLLPTRFRAASTPPGGVRLVAFADAVAILIVANHLGVIEGVFVTMAFTVIESWITSVRLSLARHQTEAGLVSSRTLRVGSHRLKFRPSIKYIQVTIDVRLNVREQVQ